MARFFRTHVAHARPKEGSLLDELAVRWHTYFAVKAFLAVEKGENLHTSQMRPAPKGDREKNVAP